VATAGVAPTVDLQAGIAALEEDLPRVLKVEGVSSLEQLGWSRPSKLVLLIPMTGIRAGQTDQYLLRLAFQAYRQWPPSAQFVNPETQAYRYPEDQHHVPMLTSEECRTHAAHPRTPTDLRQLICCSATLEFYEIQHGVQPHHLWRDTDTFFTTITAIRKAFTSSYQGRFPEHGR
jgi:hypothetical protein